jgi:thiamine-phosphate pyrophosphorylase
LTVGGRVTALSAPYVDSRATDGSAALATLWVVDRRTRLQRARLYFVADRAGMEHALAGALAGGVDLFQLRDKDASDEELLGAAERGRELCHAHDALFLLNDRPDLAAAAGADGVHVGQDDEPVSRARELVGAEALVGLSTHSMQQAQAGARSGADYIAVGPVHATPTKEGRPAVGLEPVRYAAHHADLPWFAIGGLEPGNVAEVVDAGARRVVVVRAIAQAEDPEAVARALRDTLEARP